MKDPAIYDVPTPDEVDRIMAMDEAELRAELEAEGDTFEAAADRGRTAFERAKIQVDVKKAVQAWLTCPRDKRPSSEALGQLVASIASQYPR